VKTFQGATRHHIMRTHNVFGKKYKKPQKEQVVCSDCNKLFTCDCPIRVFGRTERNYGLHLDVDKNRDYCSRFQFKLERETTCPTTAKYPRR